MRNRARKFPRGWEHLAVLAAQDGATGVVVSTMR
jgi:hypothetical protein